MPVIPKPVMVTKVSCTTKASAFSNLLYYEPPSGITTQAQMTAVAHAAFASLSAVYAPCMSDTAKFQSVECTYNTGALELIGTSTQAAVPGSMGSLPMPDQNAVVIRKQTQKPGRQNRGRFYIGGLDQGVISYDEPNEIEVTVIGVFQALAAALVADQTWDALLFHARHWDRKDNSLVVIAAGAVSTRFATQRARRRHSQDYAD